jgi:hypothetical protein
MQQATDIVSPHTLGLAYLASLGQKRAETQYHGGTMVARGAVPLSISVGSHSHRVVTKRATMRRLLRHDRQRGQRNRHRQHEYPTSQYSEQPRPSLEYPGQETPANAGSTT